MPSHAPAAELVSLLEAEPVDLGRAGLAVARVETPDLDPAPTLARLAELGNRAAARLAPLAGHPVADRIAAMNQFFYEEEGFRGNHRQYDDFRNSLLPHVLDRRLGLPISLAVVYITVARHAGLPVAGVCFPGHFLMRVEAGAPPDARPAVSGTRGFLLLDPFDGGRLLDDEACRQLLARHEEDPELFSPALLAPCSPRQIVIRMLHNLKRTYITMRSFPQAWRAADLLVALDPTLDADLRDRGLLSFHLQAWPAALHDLEDYLRRSNRAPDEDNQERERIWEHVSGLRRKVAQLN